MKRAKLVKSVFALVVIGVMVSACGDETERAAAASEDSTQESSDPFNDTNVGATFGMGTNVCIKNLSSRTLPVTMGRFDTSRGDNPLPPGKKLCLEGTYSGGQDVDFNLTLGKGNRDIIISARNQSIGWPLFYLSQEDNQYSCIFQGFASMEENAAHDGVLEYTVKRLPDTNWKEFELTLRDDPNPSSTGKTKLCPEVRPK